MSNEPHDQGQGNQDQQAKDQYKEEQDEMNLFAELEDLAEMKIIWDSQNEERLYAVNEDSLYNRIRREERSTRHLLARYEWVMIGANLVAGLMIAALSFSNADSVIDYVMPGIYLAYALAFAVLRSVRRQRKLEFAPSMVGELDKAIWHVDYLIEQTRAAIVWFIVPLTAIVSGLLFYEGSWLAAIAIVALMTTAALISLRWEVGRCYEPRKQTLQTLRQKLVATDR